MHILLKVKFKYRKPVVVYFFFFVFLFYHLEEVVTCQVSDEVSKVN